MLAIIIPYYKLTFFDETIQSLSNQTDKRFNVYIGDDASPENPSTLLEKYKGKFEFKYHRFSENIGAISLTKQWERCIALSGDEEWIMILGDDDMLGNNVVQEFYTQLNSFYGKTNIVRYASEIIKGKIISKKFEHPVWEKATDSFFRKLKGKSRSSLSEHIFLKESFLKFKFYNYAVGWHSDDYAWIEFSDNKPIYTINKSIVSVRISNISITGKTDNEELKRQASIIFIKNCIAYKLNLFNKKQRLEILLSYESYIKKSRKLTLKEWFLLLTLYLKYFNWIAFLKYFRRFLISLFIK